MKVFHKEPETLEAQEAVLESYARTIMPDFKRSLIEALEQVSYQDRSLPVPVAMNRTTSFQHLPVVIGTDGSERALVVKSAASKGEDGFRLLSHNELEAPPNDSQMYLVTDANLQVSVCSVQSIPEQRLGEFLEGISGDLQGQVYEVPLEKEQLIEHLALTRNPQVGAMLAAAAADTLGLEETNAFLEQYSSMEASERAGRDAKSALRIAGRDTNAEIVQSTPGDAGPDLGIGLKLGLPG